MEQRVLVTGASGFIAGYVVLDLLSRGFLVRGTARSAAAADAARASLAAAGADLGRVEFVTADLQADAGWPEAAAGCRFVVHVASPFPIRQPADREALVPAAREGALRVVRAAFTAGAERVVMTSSMVAMMYRADRPRTLEVGPDDWTDPEWAKLTPYIVSKTRAERAVWEEMRGAGLAERVTMVNPGFVLGPALGTNLNTSLEVIAMLLKGAYPAVPGVAFPVVDVRDLARVHAESLSAAVGGKRLVASGETLTMSEMGKALRAAFPERANKIPVNVLPDAAVRFLSGFDRSLRSLRADLGVKPVARAAETTRLTGIAFRPAVETLRDTAQSLIRLGVV